MFTLGLAMLMSASAASAATRVSGTVVRVIDGDTVWVQAPGEQRVMKVRIQGIDAPEICQPGGGESRNVLRRRLLNHTVMLAVQANDDYGRALATVEWQGTDVGRWMVIEGQAWSYRYRQDPGPYAQEEAQARSLRRGLFRQRSPEIPRSFRERHGSCYR